MSQAENANASSSKRVYRKGNPLTDAEKQQQAIARKRATHKEVKVFIEPQMKELLLKMCKQDGLTQAELLTKLIEREGKVRDLS